MWTKGSPPRPLPKNFFQVGPPVPAAGRRGADNGPWTGKTGRGRHCAFLFLFLVRMACRAQRTFERMSGIKQKRGGQSAFRVLCHERRPLCQRAVLVLPFLPGDRQWGLSGVVPGSPFSCTKRVGRRMGLGGRRGLCAQAGDRRRPQAVPVATKGATGIDSRARSLFPPKNLLTCGRSAGEARRGSCGRRPACGRRG